MYPIRRNQRRGQSLIEFVLVLPLILLLVLGTFEVSRLLATYTVLTDLAADTARFWSKPAYHAYDQAQIQAIVFDGMVESRLDTSTTTVFVETGSDFEETDLNYRKVSIEYTVQPVAPVKIGDYEIIDPTLKITAIGYFAEEQAFY